MSARPELKFAFKWHEVLGLPECPYVIRWRIETPIGSLRVHHWLGPDDDRALHDHPWWFITFVIKGGYTEDIPNGTITLNAPAIRYRPAEYQHTVRPHVGGAWTILLTGKRARYWGFWLGEKFIKANKWFASYGHHTCSE